jgi:glycine betaine/proline transport system ATP-binding protein
VSLARAFVLDPELLLLDEPFTALDPPARAKLLEDLSALLAKDHRTTIFVTHDLKEAAQLGDRVAVLVGGKLRQVGPARQIKARPADEEVAAFVRELY